MQVPAKSSRRHHLADVQQQFNENIRLKQYSENEVPRKKRDIVLDKLKTGLQRVFEGKEEPPSRYRTFNQGSYKLGTGVKPLDGDYDIDVACICAHDHHLLITAVEPASEFLDEGKKSMYPAGTTTVRSPAVSGN
ncbi:MAG: hypothetical protein GXP48_09025 [Acidobacteria bacterium]|nr:hypothetical protein [Acidobacteriota bacterium]